MQREADDPPELYKQAADRYAANVRALSDSLGVEREALKRAQSELAVAKQTRDKLAALLPTYRTEEAAYEELVQQGMAGKLAMAEKSRERITAEQDLQTQEYIIESARAAIAQSQRRIEQVTAENHQALQAERAEAAAALAQLEQELAKQNRRQELLELRAPQDGIIKDLATHTVGTVVSPGTVLMTLIPVGETLRAEAWVSNADIGFVHVGQHVKIKLAPFQFQKYGMLDGTVVTVSADAVSGADQESRTGSGDSPATSVYKALIELAEPKLSTDAGTFDLAPGMQVTAEIQLGRRTVLEYLFSPVGKAFREAGRER
jgi:hemolysin D